MRTREHPGFFVYYNKNMFKFLSDKLKKSLYAAVFTPEFKPLVADSGNRFLQAAYSDTSLSGFIQAAFNLAIVFAAILAVLRITYGGFLYMTSDIADNKSKAKSIIWNSIFGLLLLLALVIILNQINPNILNLNINLETVETISSPSTQGQGISPAEQARIQQEQADFFNNVNPDEAFTGAP